MNMIITVDSNWAMSLRGKPFVHIPDNEQLIRRETCGNVVVMSPYMASNFPGGYSYKDRVNVIYSEHPIQKFKDAKMSQTKEQLLEILDAYNRESIYVLGDEKICKMLLPMCDTVDVAYIDYEYEADSYFENLDDNEEFELVEESDEKTYFDLIYTFRRYERKK